MPWGGDILNTRGIIGRLYVKHHILYIQALDLVVSEKKIFFFIEDFFMFLIISIWQIMTSLGRGPHGPQGHSYQIL